MIQMLWGRTENPGCAGGLGSSVGVRHSAYWATLIALSAFVFGFDLGREPLWLDEVFSFAIVQHALADIVHFVRAEDPHPPLYYLLLKLATLVLGSSDAALRVPSVLAGVALVALGAGPVRRIWGHRTAYVYGCLVLVSPGVVSFAQEARMYALAAFGVTATVLYGYLAVVGRSRWDFVKLGLMSTLAAYTHYYGLLAVGITHLALLGLAGVAERRSLRALTWTLAITVLGYSPWALTLAAQVLNVSKNLWVPQPRLPFVAFALAKPFSYKALIPIPWQAVAATVLGLGLITYALVVLGRRRAREQRLGLGLVVGVYLLTLAAAFGLSVVVRPVFVPKYMIVCVGLALVAIAVGVAALPSRVPSLLALAALSLLCLPMTLRILSSTFNGPFREVARRIGPDATSTVLHTDLQTLYPSWRLMPRAEHILLFPRHAELYDPGAGVYENGRLLGTRDLTEVLAANAPVWLVEMKSARYRLPLSEILAHPGWHAVQPEQVLDAPMSWVKLRLSRFEPSPGLR